MGIFKQSMSSLQTCAMCAALVLFAVNIAHAGQQSAQFGVSVTINGPSMSVDDHPRWSDVRVLHENKQSLFQAVPGTVSQARERVTETLDGWEWSDRDMADRQWSAIGHSPQGQCMKVRARPVQGMDMVRLDTLRCDATGSQALF